MLIRKYSDSDFAALERINGFFAAIELKHHRGIDKDSIVCAVGGNEIIGFGYLNLDDGPGKNRTHRTRISTHLGSEYQGDIEITGLLTDALMKRFHELKERNPEKSMCIRVVCKTDEIKDMQFFLERGFGLSSVVPVLKYDLTQDTKHYDIPKNVTIRKLDFTAETMKAYLDADCAASEEMDAIDNEADAWFRTGDPSYTCYAAFCDENLVGAASVWDITEERAATENIFVIPAYRGKNIARELLATAFDELKSRGKKQATLSMSGTNLRAMKLYLSCGYSLYYNLLEMTYS